MPKAKTEAQIDIEDVLTPAEEDDVRDEYTVLASLGEAPDDVQWRVQVYRIPPDGSKDRALFRFTNIHELETLTDKLLAYGTGDYRVLVYRNNQIFKRLVLPVETLPQKPQAQTNSDMTVVLAAIEKQNQTMMTFMEKVLSKPETRDIDPLAMMEKTLSMAGSLAGLRPDPSPGLTPADMIALIKVGGELRGENSGGGDSGKETGVLDVLIEAMRSGTLEKLVPAAQAFSPAPIPQHIPQPQPQRIPQVPPPSVDSMIISQAIQELTAYAARNAEVTEPFDWFFQHVPMSTIGGAILQDTQLLDKLAPAFPSVMQHRGWFAAFIEAVRREVTEQAKAFEPSNPIGDTGRDGGGTGNLESDAPPAIAGETQ